VDPKRKPRIERSGEDEVTEAGLESFPASDPPAFNQAAPKDEAEARPAAAGMRAARTAMTPEPTKEPRGMSPWAKLGIVALTALVLVWAIFG
jgi:hypothetical protein